jgi:hypothetical protein
VRGGDFGGVRRKPAIAGRGTNPAKITCTHIGMSAHSRSAAIAIGIYGE